jgi:hypothetical protein
MTDTAWRRLRLPPERAAGAQVPMPGAAGRRVATAKCFAELQNELTTSLWGFGDCLKARYAASVWGVLRRQVVFWLSPGASCSSPDSVHCVLD